MMLVDEEATLEESPAIMDRIVAALRERGLIEGELTPNDFSEGKGYQPGPSIPKSYSPQPDETLFWQSSPGSIEPSVGRAFNYWALGPSWEDAQCPKCRKMYEDYDSPVYGQMVEAAGRWHEGECSAAVSCPACGGLAHVTDWPTTPPLGFGNLRFTFWHWPPFDATGWQRDIPALFRELTGHRIVVTWGRY